MTNLAHQVPIKCLSAAGGEFELSAEERTIMCYLLDGRLLVSTSHAGEMSVLEYIDRLERAGRKVQVTLVRLEEISQAYSMSGAGDATKANSAKNDSDRQEQIVSLLKKAALEGASDLHIVPVETGNYDLRMRIHGTIEHAGQELPGDGKAMLGSIYNSMSENADPHYREESSQDARLKKEFVQDAGLFGARISTRPSLYGNWMAIRLLYDNGGYIPIEKMGYTPAQIDTLGEMIRYPSGMILFSGTTGSGKSTSLQTMLSKLIELAHNSIIVSTIEDPIEYRIKGAIQTMLLGEWAEAISNNLRQDPDVLMVGEIRDYLSAIGAIRGVLTGHLLFSTVHTQDALGIIQRLLDLGVDSNLCTDPAILRGLVNQSLVRSLCEHCKLPLEGNEGRLDEKTLIRTLESCIPEKVYIAGDGCEHCKMRGVSGRSVAAEIVSPTYKFMKVFQKDGKAAARNYWVNNLGGFTKNMHVIEKINSGLVDPSHAERDVCPLDEDKRTLDLEN